MGEDLRYPRAFKISRAGVCNFLSISFMCMCVPHRPENGIWLCWSHVQVALSYLIGAAGNKFEFSARQ